jgi:hypothetical protein
MYQSSSDMEVDHLQYGLAAPAAVALHSVARRGSRLSA